MNNELENIQVTMDGFSEILSELKSEIQSLKKTDDGESALKIDLLNKIIQTIDESKRGITVEELKAYSTAMVATMRQLQDEANDSFSRFLNEKIVELDKIAKQPSIVKNHYTIDFKSSKTFIAVILISLGLLCSLFGNYNQYQGNDRLTRNDWKYRFVKMNGGIYTDDMVHLERIFSSADSIKKADRLKKLILNYEQRLKERIEKEEQIERNNKVNKKRNKEIKELT